MSTRRKKIEKKAYLVNVDAVLLQCVVPKPAPGIALIKRAIALSPIPVPVSTAYSSLNKLIKRKLVIKTGSKAKGGEIYSVTPDGRSVAASDAVTLIRTVGAVFRTKAIEAVIAQERAAEIQRSEALNNPNPKKGSESSQVVAGAKADAAKATAAVKAATMRSRSSKASRRSVREPRA